VRRFIFDDQPLAPEQTAGIIARSRTLFAAERFGLWLAETAIEHTLVGFGAFWHFREPPELELLYGVADAWVGRGYGREIARAVVAYGFGTLGMRVIRASTDADHTRSRQLLGDLGFRFERQAIVNDLDTAFYVATPDPGQGRGA
jgi:[ribosomal protein S5]-alanine N-acetyltransferase